MALRMLVDAVEEHSRAGGSLALRGALNMAAMAFAQSARFEPAAILTGHVTAALPDTHPDPEWRRRRSSVDTAMLEALGPTRLAELTAQGARMSITEASTYMREQAVLALAGS
jgi:hypothetical protein